MSLELSFVGFGRLQRFLVPSAVGIDEPCNVIIQIPRFGLYKRGVRQADGKGLSQVGGKKELTRTISLGDTM